ncbi:MAG: 2-octaprenyl-6-methoxyphenol hydroxylase [Candidatus Midichloriaceae bacterium]|jgi:2-octaprenyl-6-methoxyphenol hydroxylase
MIDHECDIVISGAGYIGLTLACLLAKKNIKICVIDKKNLNTISKNNHNVSGRLFAIASGSIAIFKKADAFSSIEKYSQPINKILIKDSTGNDSLIFSPDELDLESFGYMIEETYILDSLLSEAQKHKNITFFSENEIESIKHEQSHAICELKTNLKLKSKLIISAEGKFSKIKEMQRITSQHSSYNQDAIVFDIEHEKDHGGIALEKFFTSGPLALLPKKGGKESCIVWTEKSGVGSIVSSMRIEDVEYLVAERLNNYLGKINIKSKIAYFPLNLIRANQYYKNRVVLCGDSLHSIHPIAGQGLNLGLRDVDSLVNLIINYKSLGLDIGSNQLLDEYEKEREFDVNLMINSTHNINSIFSSHNMFMNLLRKKGMRLINNITPVKKYIMNYASGYKI